MDEKWRDDMIEIIIFDAIVMTVFILWHVL